MKNKLKFKAMLVISLVMLGMSAAATPIEGIQVAPPQLVNMLTSSVTFEHSYKMFDSFQWTEDGEPIIGTFTLCFPVKPGHY